MQLAEKYRPATWPDFIGNARAVATVRGLLASPDFGRQSGEFIQLYGATGTGKTSLAYIVARHLGAPPPRAWNLQEIDGRRCGVDVVDALGDRADSPSMYADWFVVVVNESQSMTPAACKGWLTLLERLPARWLVIWTSMADPDTPIYGESTAALMDRGTAVRLTSQGLAQPFADALYRAWLAEGMDGQLTPADCLRIVKEHGNSMRGAYADIARRIGLIRGEMVTA